MQISSTVPSLFPSLFVRPQAQLSSHHPPHTHPTPQQQHQHARPQESTKSLHEGDPAGLGADETKLYNQMAEAADPEAVEAIKKKKKEKKKEMEKKRKTMEKTKKQVGSGKGREGKASKPRTRGRHNTTAAPKPDKSTTPPSSSPRIRTTTAPSPPSSPLIQMSTTPTSSPPSSPFLQNSSSSFSDDTISTTSSQPQPQSLSHLNLPPDFTTSPDEIWTYLCWTLPWTLEQGARGNEGMYWMMDEEYLAGDFVMDCRE